VDRGRGGLLLKKAKIKGFGSRTVLGEMTGKVTLVAPVVQDDGTIDLAPGIFREM